ncbi:hypothetical protein F5Y13DRAFT_72864 [Hypoxylon sp. FL1857]|nr:hypothetical protein F5Y13DRAFT_72864 [Hypoxylon sp. FL1857]
MVVELDAHQTCLEPFGLPWSSCHTRRPDDGAGLVHSSKSRYFRISASAPTSPPNVFQVLKASSGSGDGISGSGDDSKDHTHPGRTIASVGSRFTKIQIELQPCRPRSPDSLPSATEEAAGPEASRPKPKKANSAPVVLQSQSQLGGTYSEGRERSSSSPPPSRVDAPPAACPLTSTGTPTPARLGVGKGAPAFCFPRETFATPSALPRPAKRGRALHDVDGPGTGSLSCKKRRLRLHLVTSRLSQPYSWPATHILNRESGDDSPVLSRFLKFAAVGALKKAGHQSALVRKAAILNRVRIGVRQAAVLRGHTVIAGMAARGNSLSHGLQLVTTSNTSTGARFPGLAPNPYDHPMPPAWRPHTTAFHASPPDLSPPDRGSPINNSSASSSEDVTPNPMTARRPSPPARPSAPSRPSPLSLQAEDDDEGVAFPSPDLETRYADLSDDDLDDVYADFGVLFGSGSRSPEGGSGGSEAGAGDHFYEEYLDELDGIRWVA